VEGGAYAQGESSEHAWWIMPDINQLITDWGYAGILLVVGQVPRRLDNQLGDALDGELTNAISGMAR